MNSARLFSVFKDSCFKHWYPFIGYQWGAISTISLLDRPRSLYSMQHPIIHLFSCMGTGAIAGAIWPVSLPFFILFFGV